MICLGARRASWWLVPILASCAGGSISAWEARDHLGEHRKVCGKVAATRWEPGSGDVAILYFERPAPGQPFMAVISSDLRDRFLMSPELYHRDADVCVTGVIEPSGAPAVHVRDLKQIARVSEGGD